MGRGIESRLDRLFFPSFFVSFLRFLALNEFFGIEENVRLTLQNSLTPLSLSVKQ